jgi:hypothetical protein
VGSVNDDVKLGIVSAREETVPTVLVLKLCGADAVSSAPGGAAVMCSTCFCVLRFDPAGLGSYPDPAGWARGHR